MSEVLTITRDTFGSYLGIPFKRIVKDPMFDAIVYQLSHVDSVNKTPWIKRLPLDHTLHYRTWLHEYLGNQVVIERTPDLFYVRYQQPFEVEWNWFTAHCTIVKVENCDREA